MVMVDGLKAKFELYKTFLNHILVLIVAIGGGAGGLMVKKGVNSFVTIGFIAVVSLIIVYGIIAIIANNITNDMEVENDDK